MHIAHAHACVIPCASRAWRPGSVVVLAHRHHSVHTQRKRRRIASRHRSCVSASASCVMQYRPGVSCVMACRCRGSGAWRTHRDGVSAGSCVSVSWRPGIMCPLSRVMVACACVMASCVSGCCIIVVCPGSGVMCHAYHSTRPRSHTPHDAIHN